MRYPDFIKENGRVGFIAPSFGCTIEPYRERFGKAIEYLQEQGFKTVLGPNCYEDCGIGKSNTPEKCGEEVNDFFLNDRSDIIISCGGGELMCEDIPFIDFEGIKNAKPKWYMGYSDNTNLTFLLNTICDTASIYGPNAPKFGDEPIAEYVVDALSVLKGEKSSVHNYDEWLIEKELISVDIETESAGNDKGEYSKIDNETKDSQSEQVNASEDEECIVMPYKQKIYVGNETKEEANFSGRLIGGCLDCLVNLVGTKFDKVEEFSDKYKEDGIIWFLESCDLNVFDMRRALWHMKNADWFKKVKGFIIGRPFKYYDAFGEFDHIEAVQGILGDLNVPIIMDIDIGHLPPQMTIISGACANVAAKGNEISIDYKLA